MIKANYAYTQMKNALNLKPSHSSENEYLSAYGVFHISDNNVVAVRAANHGTFLYNWLKMSNAPFNIDLLSSANIAITFIDDSIPFTQNNDIIVDDNSKPPVFVVKQYVYNCNNLDVNDLNLIIEASKRLIQNGVYTDPLEDDTNKRATIWREKTNENPKNITSRIIKKT